MGLFCFLRQPDISQGMEEYQCKQYRRHSRLIRKGGIIV